VQVDLVGARHEVEDLVVAAALLEHEQVRARSAEETRVTGGEPGMPAYDPVVGKPSPNPCWRFG
jgi:hypothetical protein